MEGNVSHLGIIMDGNRRWAKKHGMPALFGHKKGYEKAQKVFQWCLDRDISMLTVYAFSTENWERSEEEVNYLMNLLEEALSTELKTFQEKNIRVNIIGRKARLRTSILKKIEEIESATKDNTGGTLNIALNYGGRAEIIHAMKQIVDKGYKREDITKELIDQHLYIPNMPDPDLIIRTSGEFRTSNFLLWQAAYAEWCFIPILWPDFTEKDLDDALLSYQKRKRRYGK